MKSMRAIAIGIVVSSALVCAALVMAQEQQTRPPGAVLQHLQATETSRDSRMTGIDVMRTIDTAEMEYKAWHGRLPAGTNCTAHRRAKALAAPAVVCWPGSGSRLDAESGSFRRRQKFRVITAEFGRSVRILIFQRPARRYLPRRMDRLYCAVGSGTRLIISSAYSSPGRRVGRGATPPENSTTQSSPARPAMSARRRSVRSFIYLP